MWYCQRSVEVLAVYDFHDPNLVRNKLGVVVVDNEGRLIGFQEKPERPLSGIAATAPYFFSPPGPMIPIVSGFPFLNIHDPPEET